MRKLWKYTLALLAPAPRINCNKRRHATIAKRRRKTDRRRRRRAPSPCALVTEADHQNKFTNYNWLVKRVFFDLMKINVNVLQIVNYERFAGQPVRKRITESSKSVALTSKYCFEWGFQIRSLRRGFYWGFTIKKLRVPWHSVLLNMNASLELRWQR